MADKTSSAVVPAASQGGELAEAMLSKEDLALLTTEMEGNISEYSVKHARLAIVQPGTPEVTEQVPGYKAGQLMTNTEKQVISMYTKQPWLLGNTGVNADELKLVNCLEVLCCFKLPDEYIQWVPKAERTEGEGLWKFKTLIRTPEVINGLPDWRGGKWRKSDTQPSPPVTENCNLLIAPLNQAGDFSMAPIVASFSRTSFKTGEKLVNACRQHRHMQLPWHGRTYWLWTEFQDKEKGKYWRLRMSRGRPLTELPDWREKNAVLLTIARALANPEPSDQKDEDGKVKSKGRVQQELLIAAAAMMDESEHEAGEAEPDDFTTDHFGKDDKGGENPF